jgi:hypothetical protein
MRMAEFVQFRAPCGFTEALVGMAEKEGTSVSGFIRSAVMKLIDERSDEAPEGNEPQEFCQSLKEGSGDSGIPENRLVTEAAAH